VPGSDQEERFSAERAMKNVGRVLAVAAAVALIVGGIGLFTTTQAATYDLAVTANVKANCTVAAGQTLAFGDYDAVTYATDDLDLDGKITITCSKGATVHVTLSDGGNYTTTRRMILSGNYLDYNLYTTSARDVVWRGATEVTHTYAAKGDFDVPVYGRVPQGQDPVAGDGYSDTVVATFTF
jgi:spore coat protein U-like protein